MAESQGQMTTTASRYAPEKARGRHMFEFEVTSHSLLKGLGVGAFIESAPFTVGGRDWCINYFPNGDCAYGYEDYAAVFLHLLSGEDTVGRALAIFDFRVSNPASDASKFVHSTTHVL